MIHVSFLDTEGHYNIEQLTEKEYKISVQWESDERKNPQLVLGWR